MTKKFYKRRLPHWHPPNAVFDINFRLANTLPRATLLELKKIRDQKIKTLKESFETESEIKYALQQERTLYYGKYEELLDRSDFGPTWLSQPAIAEIVAEAFLFRHQEGIFKLICYSIMPNHVHAIFYKTQKPLFRILQSLKRQTAKKANLILNRTGKPFWSAESYDHVIRNRESLQNKIAYHLNNPTKAKLCSHWKEWEFNFLNPEFEDWM